MTACSDMNSVSSSGSSSILGPNLKINIITATVKLAATYNSPAHAIPHAADTQTAVAVLNPCTLWPSSWDCFQITALPKNPTPLGIAAILKINIKKFIFQI